MATEVLKIYADRKSQPTRAVCIFCKVNGIDFEEVKINLFTPDMENPEFVAANPLKKQPAIAHGEFTLFESHAILTYLANWYQVPDHWYPADLRKRAKVQCVLDWHHTNLRSNSVKYLLNTVLAPIFGLTPKPEEVAKYQQNLIKTLSTIESLWLQGDSKFLLGNDKPSLADLSLVCEIMQFQMMPKEERNKILGSSKKIQQWIENVKEATNPHFDEFQQAIIDIGKANN